MKETISDFHLTKTVSEIFCKYQINFDNESISLRNINRK